MIIVCHNCSARYKIKDDLVAGGPKRTKCKNCGTLMLIVPPAEGAGPDVEVLTRDGSSAAAAQRAPQEKPARAERRPAAEAGEPPAGRKSQAETAADVAESTAAAGPEPEEPESREEGAKAEPAAVSAGEPDRTPSEKGTAEKEEEKAEKTGEEKKKEKPEESDPLAKIEKRRQQMEDEISGRLHKAALETLDFKDLELLAKKIKKVEENPELKPEDNEQLFCCIECNTVYSVFPDDPRTCSNCPGDAPLIRGADIIRQYSMFRRA